MPTQDYTKWKLPQDAKARLGKGYINEIAYSPDSSRLAVASSIGIWIYDARTGKELDLLTQDMDWVNSISFGRDNRYLASGSANGKVCLWDTATGKYIKTFVEYPNSVFSVCFSPDGRILASGTGGLHSDGETRWAKVELWDTETSTHIKTIGGDISSVNSVCFNPNGQILANGRGRKYDYDYNEWRGGTVELWDVETGGLVKRLSTYNGSVNSVAFGSEGRCIAGGSEDGTVWVWDVETGELIKRLKGLWDDAITSISFRRDGSLLAGSSDGTVRLWDVETEKHITFTGHAASVTSVSFSGYDYYFASSSEDGTVKLWSNLLSYDDPHLMTLVIGHASSVNSVCFSFDNHFLASGSMDGTVRLWDVENREHIITLIGQTDFVSSVSFSPNSRFLASGSGDGTVGLWDVGDHTSIKMLGESILLRKKVGCVGTGPDMIALTGHIDAVRSVCFSPDGRFLVSGSGIVEFLGGTDNTVRLWDVETGKQIKALKGHTDPIGSVCFSSDSRVLASGSWDKTICLWNVTTGERIRTLTKHTNQVNSVCFSPDSRVLASGGSDNTGRLWDVATGKLSKTLIGHTSKVNSVCFSPDGRLLASGSYDKTVRLWDVATGKQIKTLTGHTSSVESVSFSLDREIVVSASKDGTVLLWEIPSYRPPDINPQEILGNWRAGWALDVHTLSSRPLPGGGYDTERTEFGELVFQLKYRHDRSKIQPIAEIAAKFVKEKFAVDGHLVLPYITAIIPIPPSDINRGFQPVTEVAQEIGRLLNVPVRTDYLTKAKQTIPLKNLPDVENKREQLHGAFAVRSQDLKNRCVLLVDDLYDSGTTLTEATKVLYEQGGVQHVLVLALTRTRTGRD